MRDFAHTGRIDNALVKCIEECFDCAQVCISCADACLGESNVQQLTQCIRLNLDCADICSATGSVASRWTGSNEQMMRDVIGACAQACRLCAEECRKHAGKHEHCRACAEVRQSCEQACREAVGSIH